MSPQPKINDQFWFDMSYDMIKDSIKRLQEGANKIEKLLLWAFGIYTASAIFTVEYKFVNELWILLVLCFPYILLILGYWFSHVAQLPISQELDYRSPTLIEEAYSNGYNIAKRRLNVSKWFTFIGLFVLSISLMAAYVLKNQPQPQIYLDTEVSNKDSTLYVTGLFPKEEILKLKIISNFDRDSTSIIKNEYLNTKSGVFQKAFSIDTTYKKIQVEILWTENGYEYKIAKKILK